MKVLFAPDYRDGNPYQGRLAAALAKRNIHVVFPPGYRRFLPFTRMVRSARPDLVHLHWPEAYAPARHDGRDGLRRLRLAWDLRLGNRSAPIVLTAHNFLPHHSPRRADRSNAQAALRIARSVIAHSTAATEELVAAVPSLQDRVVVIPHGDLADGFPPLPDRFRARAALGISPSEKVVLMFGRIEPYKGIESVLAAWPLSGLDARLWIAGIPRTPQYGETVRARAAERRSVTTELAWISDQDLATRLAAADVVLFNYTRIFTSGAACLVRSFGVPLALPARNATVDLDEPAPTVFRFDSVGTDLPQILSRALAAPRDDASAIAWREKTSWDRVAADTLAVYSRTVV